MNELSERMRLFKLLIVLTILLISVCFLTIQSDSAQEIPCLDCHVKLKEKAKSVHAAVALGCPSCHKVAEGKTHPGQKGGIVLVQNMPGLCYTCHDESKFKGKSVHTPVTSGLCTGCHDPHQSNYPKILLKDIPGLCYNCHKESKFKGGKSGHTNIGMCTGCHNPHASNANRILLAEQPDLCYTCHEKTNFTKKYVHSVIPVAGCTSCHTPHISPNPALLPSPVFELCTSCHAAKSDGRHIVALPGKRIHPLKGVPDPATIKMIKVFDKKSGKEIEQRDPNNPAEKEITCTTCHNPHSSDFAKLFPQKNICGRCHKYY